MSLHINIGTAAPSTTPTEVGHHFIDTNNKVTYISVGTATSADWQSGTGLTGNVRIAAGYLEIQNDTDALWYQLRCQDSPDGYSELFLSDTGSA